MLTDAGISVPAGLRAAIVVALLGAAACDHRDALRGDGGVPDAGGPALAFVRRVAMRMMTIVPTSPIDSATLS